MITPRRALRETAPPAGHVRIDSWRDHAACNQHPTLPPSTWDDVSDGDGAGRPGTDTRRARRISTAKAVCDGCPVKNECLADVDLAFDDGVRGGIDLRDLRRHGRAV